MRKRFSSVEPQQPASVTMCLLVLNSWSEKQTFISKSSMFASVRVQFLFRTHAGVPLQELCRRKRCVEKKSGLEESEPAKDLKRRR